MLLNRIWVGLFLVGIIVAVSKLIFWQDFFILERMTKSIFEGAKSAFELAIGLTGALCFWLGFMRIGEKSGAIQIISRVIAPFFKHIFPEIPKDHPAVGSIMMNFSANMLGLDNSATPLGLKAMKEMQELNPDKETASNAQIMFLALNTAGLTIIPIGVLSILAQYNSTNPTGVFIPILITTFSSALFALFLVAFKQRINLFKPIVIAYILTGLGFVYFLLAITVYFPEKAEIFSSILGNGILFLFILSFLLMAMRKKIVIYDEFIEGAKEGFQVAISIVPYVVGILCAIKVFIASGSMDAFLYGLKETFMYLGLYHVEFVDALPVGLMKPFSGSGARAMLQAIIENKEFGVDHFVTKIASTMQGGTETTFYTLAVYFGAVKVKKTRYTAGVGLLVDLFGIVTAIIVSYIFFK
jgi:spore maturation protein SpmA